MVRKKAQFGLDSLVGYLAFGTFLLFTIITLSIGGCDNDKIKSGLTVDGSKIEGMRMSEQLSAYLRTDMPDKDALIAKIESLKDDDKKSLIILQRTDADNAVDFLESHPEIYVGKTYGDFISALYVYRAKESEVQNVFDAVTKAMFHRELHSKRVRDLNEGRLDNQYFSPIMHVKYETLLTYGYGNEDLLSTVVTVPISTKVFKILPTQDKVGITVKLQIYQEKVSQPLP